MAQATGDGPAAVGDRSLRVMVRAMKALLPLAALFLPSLVHADSQIHQTTRDPLTVNFEKASGEPTTVSLSPGVSGGGYQSVPTLEGKTLEVSVTNAAGDVLAKRGVVDDRHYLLWPHKGGTFSIEEGGVAGTPIDRYPGIVIVNTLEEPVSLDLFGTSGQFGAKNVKLATALDVKQVIALPMTESDYTVMFHLADGKTFKSDVSVGLGTYAFVMRNNKDELVVSSLGYIVKPAMKTSAPDPVKATPKSGGKKKSK
jgi:hypothetical protein